MVYQITLKYKNIFYILLCGAIFTGCTGNVRAIYYWDSSYSKSIYEYLNQEGDINEQIANLENLAKNAHANGLKVPPGLYAHLGLLYLNLGDGVSSKANFDKEAQLFPESRSYIEFLKKQNRKTGVKNVAKN